MDVRGRMPIMPPIPEFDPVALATQLGAPVAVLIKPKDRCRVGGLSTDSVHRFGPSAQLPVRAEINYRFDSDDFTASGPSVGVLMYTRRPQPELPAVSVREHIEMVLVDYQLGFGSRTDSPPWATGQGGGLRPPRQVAEHLGRERTVGWRNELMTVDGQELSWDYLTEPDIATDEIVVALGGRVGDVLVAVAGPERLLTPGIVIGMVHGRQRSAELA